MKKTGSKNKSVIITLIVTVILLVVVGLSYSFTWADFVTNEPVDVTASTAKVALKYTDCPSGNAETCGEIEADLAPGDSVSKEFRVTNIGTVQTQFTLYFRELYNTFIGGDLVYTLEDITNNEVLMEEREVPYGQNDDFTIIRDVVAPLGATLDYRITVKFLNRDYDQWQNIGAEFSLKLGLRDSSTPQKGELMAVTSNYNEKLWAHKSDVSKIVFENALSSRGATYSYDISNGQDESVMTYLVPDEEESGKYIAYIQADGNIKANSNSSHLFYAFKNLSSFENMEFLDTSNVTNMRSMFNNCKSLETLDLSNFDTSNVTDMSYMFNTYDPNDSTVSKLTSIIFSSKFNTNKVVNMRNMFQTCKSLTTLDLSNFDTSNVTDMSYMFNMYDPNDSTPSKLTSITFSSKFNTSKVTNMSYMFQHCKSLTTLDLNNFDTSNVTNMGDMFNICKSLETLDLSNFDTSNVTNMSFMFNMYDSNDSTPSKLTSIIFSSKFNTNKVVNMRNMFQTCKSLTTLDLSNFDTSNVTDMSYMFNMYDSNDSTPCKLTVIIFSSKFNTNKVVNMRNMFQHCKSLTTLDLSNFDTSNVTDMRGMFLNCKSLETLDLSNFDTSNVTDMSYMFNMYDSNDSTPSKLTSITFSSKFNTSKVTDMGNMFQYCKSLTTLSLSNFDTSNVTNMRSMFLNCSALTTVGDISTWNTSNVTNMTSMFAGCWKLNTTLTIRGTNCTTYKNMLQNAGFSSYADSMITLNYTEDASSLVDEMLKTATYSHVQKGVQVA